MSSRSATWITAWIVAAWLAAATALSCHAATRSCRRLVLDGEASAGKGWSAPIGEGWRFRLVPVPPLDAGYSGWDLVVDRMEPAGFPDALYLATPPYNSINEREVGTTFGLRSQDAIGWNPRSFRFLTDPAAVREAQQVYKDALLSPRNISAPASAPASTRLLTLAQGASPGQFRILDARISPGISDPAPFAQAWAQALSRTPHEIDTAAPGKQAAAGSLNWIRFEVILWLPSNWKLPPGTLAATAACGQ